MMHKHTAQMLALSAVVLGLSACATQAPAPVAKPAAAAPAPVAAPTAAATPMAAVAAEAKEFYVALPKDGRIYAFGDTKNYFDYLAHGEVTLTRTRIGEGPGGKTLVFGITPDDVKKNQPSLGELVMGGKLPQVGEFYGEVFKDGRYYLFGELKDMQAYTAFGEVPYSFTDIGAGPKGETLVYVMNKDSYKQGRPTARMERFKSLRMAGK